MVRVATCGQIDCEYGDITSALERCAARRGIGDVSVVSFVSPIDLIDACTNSSTEEPFDLIVVPFDLAGLTGVQLAIELQTANCACDKPSLYLCAPDESYAYEAYEAGVAGYLIEPVTEDQFHSYIGAALEQAVCESDGSVVLYCRDRVRRVSFEQLLYAETSGHDQAVHLVNGEAPCVVRSSSNALFELLADDGRFFKVGSSYIVNMDYVRSLSTRAGVVTLEGGMQIPVPVRLRKAMGEALCQRSGYVL